MVLHVAINLCHLVRRPQVVDTKFLSLGKFDAVHMTRADSLIVLSLELVVARVH